MDRHVADRAEAAVDPADDAVRRRAQLLVLGHVGARRHGDLQQADLADHLGVLLEQRLDREQLLRDALDVVEPVDAEQHLHPVELRLQLGDPRAHLWALDAALEALRVDADREGVDAHRVALDAAALRIGERPVPRDVPRAQRDVPAEQVGARVQEVARVLVDVEAEEVGAEQPLQELAPHRQHPEDLRRRPRRVQEPADAQPRLTLAQQAGQQHQVVVVHPHHVLGARNRRDGVGKLGVGQAVRLPLLLLEAGGALLALGRARDVVEERPEHVVAEAVVVAARERLVEEDGHAAAPQHVPAHLLHLLGRRVLQVGPPHPDAPHVLDAEERRDHPTRRHRELELPARPALDRDRQPIGNHHDPRRGALPEVEARGVLRLLQHVHVLARGGDRVRPREVELDVRVVVVQLPRRAVVEAAAAHRRLAEHPRDEPLQRLVARHGAAARRPVGQLGAAAEREQERKPDYE